MSTAVASPADAVPDRLRRHHPPGGGPRPDVEHVEAARRGLKAARDALERTPAEGPGEPTVVARMTPEQRARARRGMKKLRQALETSRHGNTLDHAA